MVFPTFSKCEPSNTLKDMVTQLKCTLQPTYAGEVEVEPAEHSTDPIGDP